MKSLHFAWAVNDAKCILVTGHARLCVCLPVAIFPHYCTDPGVTWRDGRTVGVPPSCALLGRFAICARVSLLWRIVILFFALYKYSYLLTYLVWQLCANAKCQRVLVLALCSVHGFVVLNVIRWLWLAMVNLCITYQICCFHQFER